MLWHVMLMEKEIEDDAWGTYETSIWKVWGFSLGEFDDSAYPTSEAAVIFTAFAVAIIIVMVKIASIELRS